MTDTPAPEHRIGEIMRRRRLAAGLSHEALAERAGLSARTLRNIERGNNRRPYPDTLRRLSDALGLTLEERDALAAPSSPGRPAPRPAVSRPTAPMVGRAAELSRVERFLAGEGPPVLLVTGEPGIGKSRLLAELAGRAPAAGWVALGGGCHRRSAQEPYSPLPAALAGHLAALPPGRRRAALAGCDRLVRLLPELAGEVEPPYPVFEAHAASLPASLSVRASIAARRSSISSSSRILRSCSMARMMVLESWMMTAATPGAKRRP